MKNKEDYWDIDLKKVLKSDLIKKFMRDNQLSHKQFAKMANVSLSTFIRFLNGCDVKFSVLYYVSRAMKLTGDDLINREAIKYQTKGENK